MSKKTATKAFKMSIYIPQSYYDLLQAVSAATGEPPASLARRLLLPQIEQTAKNHLVTSLALEEALRTGAIPKELISGGDSDRLSK